MKSYLPASIWGLLLVAVVQARTQKPISEGDGSLFALPECAECTPREVVEEPGVGFDLNMGYATAAIKFYNGSVVDVDHLDTPSEYNVMMRKFSPPYIRYGPPFDTTRERIAYNLELAMRRWRRFRGLASTPEIAILSSVLQDLRDSTSLALAGSPVTKVLPSFPWLPNLQGEDLVEAFQLAGLELLRTFSWYETLQQSNAAWAGMGNGLCEHYRDFYRCQEEEDEMPYKEVLAVSLTNEELSVEKLGTWDVHKVAKLGSAQYADLGFGAWRANTQNKTFWDRVGEKALAMARQDGWKKGDVDELLLMGEFGEEKMFLDALWKALGELKEVKVQDLWKSLQVGGFSAEFVAARGAAELARREQNLVWDCVDGEWCEDGGEVSDQELKRI